MEVTTHKQGMNSAFSARLLKLSFIINIVITKENNCKSDKQSVSVIKHKMTLLKGKHTLTNIDKVTNIIFGQVRFNTVRLTNTVGHVAPDSRVISRCRCIIDSINVNFIFIFMSKLSYFSLLSMLKLAKMVLLLRRPSVFPNHDDFMFLLA